jgi:hypothetical protein
VVSFTPRPLYFQRKNRSYPLDRRLGMPQSQSGNGGEEKNSQPLPGLEPPIIQPLVQDRNFGGGVCSFEAQVVLNNLSKSEALFNIS